MHVIGWFAVFVTIASVLWHVHRHVRRQQARRLLATVIACADRSGVVHWLHGVTLFEWFRRRDCASSEQHLALVVLHDSEGPVWAAFRRHLAAEDLTMVRGGDPRWGGVISRGNGGVRLVLHSQRATADGLYVSPHRFPSESMPIWLIGHPSAEWWPQGGVFVRTPAFPRLAAMWSV